MSPKPAAPSVGHSVVVDRSGLDALIGELRSSGRRVFGPVVRDQAIAYDEVESVDELPAGWGDEQAGGRYRLHRRGDDALFGYAAPSESWKRLLYPPRALMIRSRKTPDGFEVEPAVAPPEALALFGVRSCDLHAITIQDRVLLGGAAVEPGYSARRRDAFIVAVSCGSPSATCFCVSMQTGPQPDHGFDLSLTELVSALRHDFVVQIGTRAGAEVMAKVPHRSATADDTAAADTVVAHAAATMGRRLDADAPRRAAENLDHPQWQDVADRCLACGNCTMVCPTCFCSTTEDHTSIDGTEAERWRRWDSCFSLDFSNLHGGPVRASVLSRYRQWLLHKLVTWEDQFGTSGCVGCGRCITWCPVGIDLTDEIAKLAERWKEGDR